MDYDTWMDEFKPVKNTIDENAGYDGCLFETYGEELEAVKRIDPEKIWTLVDGDDGQIWVESGCHFVNRIGYFITEKKADKDYSFRADD